MPDTAVRVSALSKRYLLGATHRRPDMIREHLIDGLKSLLSGDREARNREREIWALRDVSFSVASGELFGIIGRNGAGKSTLLKILSRIVEPTAGRVEIYGRMSSLLEVGTGFHPELTGRENIYLNGAILGMSRAEIERKFDEIVAFAELARFIDTPVKRYSSGMYVRLAFSVAAHLEPDILLLDEVLAVGDAAFQRKCLGKMEDAAKRDRTVLFVSHNLPAVQALCARSLVLEGGRVAFIGNTADALNHYLSTTQRDASFRADAIGRSRYISEARVVTDVSGGAPTVEHGHDLVVDVSFVNRTEPMDIAIVVGIETRDMVRVMGPGTFERPIRSRLGTTTIRLTVPKLPVTEGSYLIGLFAYNWETYQLIDQQNACLTFEVVAGPDERWLGRSRAGLIPWDCEWEIVGSDADGPAG
jgi:homopolymeric O-antigen transport system ATP-binding protein